MSEWSREKQKVSKPLERQCSHRDIIEVESVLIVGMKRMSLKHVKVLQSEKC